LGLTQAASLAATASYNAPASATNTCAGNPAKAASKNAAAADVDPAQDKIFIGGL